MCVSKDGKKGPGKSDFAIKLDMLIEAKQNTGYLATVKRAIDGEQRYIIILMCNEFVIL